MQTRKTKIHLYYSINIFIEFDRYKDQYFENKGNFMHVRFKPDIICDVLF